MAQYHLVYATGFPFHSFNTKKTEKTMVLVLVDEFDHDIVQVMVFAAKGHMEEWLQSAGGKEVYYESLLKIRELAEQHPLPETSTLKSVRMRGQGALYFAAMAKECNKILFARDEKRCATPTAPTTSTDPASRN